MVIDVYLAGEVCPVVTS